MGNFERMKNDLFELNFNIKSTLTLPKSSTFNG